MPYTPPSRRSPSSSTSNSPSLTRNHSYDRVTPSSGRPELPRSRSAAYIQKHRRAPSLPENHTVQQYGSIVTSSSKPLVGHEIVASPVDAAAGSSEEDDDRGRSRQIANLAEALKESMMTTKRQRSPTRKEDGSVPLAPRATPAALIPIDALARNGLTPEARKIAHSRSSSDLLNVPTNFTQLSGSSSPGDSDDDCLEMRRAPLVRKKSGELVKPALRASSRKRPVSMPGTPTYPKAVHFNENIEQVRHFLQVDRPMAVSADSSPVEQYESENDYPFAPNISRRARTADLDLKTANFPVSLADRQFWPVRVESINLSNDGKSMIGVVAVANIAFEKYVSARFTFDYWKTTSEMHAEWNNNAYKHIHDGYDRFQFAIKLSDHANLQNKTMYLCVRYNAGGQEHWDNNAGANYQIDFTRKAQKQWVKPAAAGTNGVIPRSRHTGNASLPRPRSFPMGSDDEFTSPAFRPRSKTSPSQKVQSFQDPSSQPASRLSNRYDFNSSLHAALTTAQLTLGDDSGLRMKIPASAKRSRVAPAPVAKVSAVPAIAAPQPKAPAAPSPAAQSNVTPARPTLGSAEYQDLISKFCYFGSGGTNTTITSPKNEVDEAEVKKQLEAHTDREADSSSESNPSSADSSATNSPPSPKVQLHQPSPDSRTSARTASPSLRAISPRLLPYRSPSPAHTSAYHEFSHQGLSVQSAQC